MSWRIFDDTIYRARVSIIAVAAIFAVHMLNFPFASYRTLVDRGPSWYGLDVSWQMQLNYVLLKGLTWGTDIISTHGPLGFLATRIGWGISRWVFLAFDLFIVANFFLIFKDFISGSANKLCAVLIIFCLTLLQRPYIGQDLPWVLLVMVFYWMYRSYQNPGLLNFILLSLFVTITFYCKLNTGIAVVVLFIFHVTNLLVFKKISLLRAAGVLLIPIVFILTTALAMHVSLGAYIKGGLEIMRGYNDIMYLEQSNITEEENINLLYRCTIGLYLVYAFYLAWDKKYSEIFFVILCIAFSFLLKKQSVVRNDTSHLQGFLRYGPLVFLFLNKIPLRKKIQLLVLLSSSVITLLHLSFNSKVKPVNAAFLDRYTHKKEYLFQFINYNSREYLNQKDKRKIPAGILQKIDHHTIDIFPWDSEYLMENKLNFTPRPISGSLTKYLQDMNYQFYLRKPPEFVIYDYDAIDERYPFSDEFPVNLFLVKNYSVVDTFTSNER